MDELAALLKKNKEAVENVIPDKRCGVKRCSDCPRPICQRQLTPGTTKPIREIPLETIERLSVQSFGMHNLFTNG